MSTYITEHPCLISHTWEIYPRVFYFRGRIIDFDERFQRIVKVIPDVLRDQNLPQNLQHVTEKFKKGTLSIIVIGRENLSPDVIFVSTKALEGTKEYAQDNVTTIAICYVTIDKLDRSALKETVLNVRHFNDVTLKERKHQIDSLIVMCKTKTTFTEEECTMFRQNIFSEVPKSAHWLLGSTANIIITSDVERLKHHISTMFETRIVEAFINIRRYLSHCVLESTLGDRTELELLKDRYVTKAIQSFLRNGFGLSDIAYESCDRKSFLSQLIVKIANIVKCVVIVPLSSKYTLPSWLCNRLLHDIQFEDVLVKSVSKRTHHHLFKLHSFAVTCSSILQNLREGTVVLSSDIVNACNCTAFDFVVKLLQNDFRNATVEAENKMSSMKKLRTTMHKMIFEIDGYLKQTIVKHETIPQTGSTFKIPDMMRNEIMSMTGVYGMGTIYGALEIHLDEDDEARLSDLTNRIRLLMREHQFRNTYLIKYVKH